MAFVDRTDSLQSPSHWRLCLELHLLLCLYLCIFCRLVVLVLAPTLVASSSSSAAVALYSPSRDYALVELSYESAETEHDSNGEQTSGIEGCE